MEEMYSVGLLERKREIPVERRAMRQTVFLIIASLVCVLAVSAQQRNIDAQKSTLTIHVGKTSRPHARRMDFAQ
jgi:ABC-type metal ion transport system substrate-binding protein